MKQQHAQNPSDALPRRPYGLTEADQLRLLHTRNTALLLQSLSELDAQNLHMVDPLLIGSAFWLLAEQLEQVLNSVDSAEDYT